jgi:hypothetical protein
MKAQKLIIFIGISYLALNLVVPIAWGILIRNPYENPLIILYILIINGILNILIKYIVFHIGLSESMLQRKDIFTTVLMVNLVIFPIHRLFILFFFSYPGANFYGIGLILTIYAIISAVLGEIFLYDYQFNKNFQIKTLRKKKVFALSLSSILIAYLFESFVYSFIIGIFTPVIAF